MFFNSFFYEWLEGFFADENTHDLITTKSMSANIRNFYILKSRYLWYSDLYWFQNRDVSEICTHALAEGLRSDIEIA